MTVFQKCVVFAALLAATFSSSCSDPAVKKQRYLDSGNRYFDEGQFSHAIIEYQNAVDVDPTFGAARKRLAEAYAKTGDLARSLDEFVKAADVLTNDAEVQLNAGTMLLAAGKLQEAIDRADKALKIQPDSVRAYILRGNALAGLTSFDEALKAIEEAIRLDPSRGSTFTQKAFIELASGRSAEA